MPYLLGDQFATQARPGSTIDKQEESMDRLLEWANCSGLKYSFLSGLAFTHCDKY